LKKIVVLAEVKKQAHRRKDWNAGVME